MITRRKALVTLAGAAGTALVRVPAWAQGISSRGVKPQPRGKPSGRPFLAQFTDIAKPAGLIHPAVYGGVETKKYIVEVVGAGVAFIDYDNDGWMDLLVLCGTQRAGIRCTTTTETALSRMSPKARDSNNPPSAMVRVAPGWITTVMATWTYS